MSCRAGGRRSRSFGHAFAAGDRIYDRGAASRRRPYRRVLEGAGETCIDWSDTSEPFWTATSNPVAGHCDVAVVFGPPWFLPLVGAYYRIKDRFQ